MTTSTFHTLRYNSVIDSLAPRATGGTILLQEHRVGSSIIFSNFENVLLCSAQLVFFAL
jgi:hypothetical protein